jgi:hypothetical protein
MAAERHEFKNQAPINSKEPIMETREHREVWNKGKLVGQKAPLKPKDIWAIRIHLQNAHEVRDLAMFNLAAEDEGDLDLQTHEEPAGRSAPAGPLQARVDSAVLGHRGR